MDVYGNGERRQAFRGDALLSDALHVGRHGDGRDVRGDHDVCGARVCGARVCGRVHDPCLHSDHGGIFHVGYDDPVPVLVRYPIR